MAENDLGLTEADFKLSDAALTKRLLKEGKTDSEKQAEIWVQKARARHNLLKATEAKKAAKALERAAKIAQERLDAEKIKNADQARKFAVGEVILEAVKTDTRLRDVLKDHLKGKENLFPDLFTRLGTSEV